MSVFSKRKVNVAAKRNKSHIALPSRVITTNDFGFCQPIFCREVVPGDSWKFDLDSFTRLAPMPVPTYADIRNVTRGFYIRYSSLWKPWEDFLAGREYIDDKGTPHIFTSVPTITNDTLCGWFTNTVSTQLSTVVGHDADVIKYDFFYRRSDGQDELRNFTPAGRRLFTLLNNLGYKLNFASQNRIGSNLSFSLLPLLAYLRAYYDYYLPSRFTNKNQLRYIFDLVEYNNTEVFNLMQTLVSESLYNNYDSDYFTASWLDPQNPDATEHFVSSISAPITANSKLGVQIEPQSHLQPLINTVDTLSNLSQPVIDLLKRSYDYVIRNGLSGNRYFEQIFARFGIKLPNMLTRRCEFIGQYQDNIQVMDVTAMAQSAGTPLGAYAGKGYVASHGNMSFEANDYGVVVLINTIIPQGGYVQGVNREMTHTKKLDFFTPEFDCIGMQAIANYELIGQSNTVDEMSSMEDSGYDMDGVFGFVPRYSEYRRPIDILSGTFVLGSQNAGYNCYHSFRLFDLTSTAYPSNTLSFRQLDPAYNGNDYQRIFYVDDDSVDHFITVHNIKADVFRKMKTFDDAFDLDGSEKVTTDPDCQLH